MKRTVLFLAVTSCLLVACNGGVTPDASTAKDAAEIILQRVAELVCPYPSDPDDPDLYERHFSRTDTAYTFACSPAMGHNTTVTMRWFGNQSEAEAVFETQRKEASVEKFHGFPLSARDEDYPSFPGGRKEYRIWLWQAHQWLIEVRAFDDTHFLIAPDPETVSEAIYQLAVEHGLFR